MPLLEKAITAIARLDGMSMVLLDASLFLYMYVRKEAVLSSRINLSRSGIGGSIGVKGFRKGIDAHGREYTHTSIPGTGIYSRTYSKNRISLDDDGNFGRPATLNTSGKLVIFTYLAVFLFMWFAGESFWFAFGFMAIVAVVSVPIMGSKIFDYGQTPEDKNRQKANKNETYQLEQELSRLEAMEHAESNSPFHIFELDENCTREELNRAFKNKIKKYHPDRLEQLGPELQELGKLKSREIIEAYEKCAEIFHKRKST